MKTPPVITRPFTRDVRTKALCLKCGRRYPISLSHCPQCPPVARNICAPARP